MTRRRLSFDCLENRLMLSIVPPNVPGDVNHDDIVNGQDIALLASNWLRTGSNVPGDANDDGIVNGQDIPVIASHWLQFAPTLTPPTATAGQALSNITVMRFDDTSTLATVSDYSATITLGDGNSLTVNGTPGPNGQIVADPSGGFDVQMSYTYATTLSNATFGASVQSVDGSSASSSTSAFSVASANPTNTSNLQLWLDPTDTSTMKLENAAETSGQPTSNLQYSSGTPFDFQGNGTDSQFTMAFWVYPEAPWNNNSWLIADAKDTFGTNDISWFVSVPYGAGGQLRTTYATGPTTIATETYNEALPSPNQWYFVVSTYDGSQVGDTLRQQVYVNGQELTTPAGNVLPQKIYAAPHPGKLYLGAVDASVNGETPERFQDVGFWNHLIDSSTAAALWNGGAGQTLKTLPAAANDPFAYYSMGEASGTRYDSTGHYDLTAGAAGVGSITEISSWQDKSANHLTFLFGYDPDTGLHSENISAFTRPRP